MKAERCQAISKSGKPCSATVVADGMCAWHAPSWAERRRQWSAEGGRKRSNRERARKRLPGAVMTAAELQGLVGTVLRGVIGGEVEPAVGNCVANLSRSLLELRKGTELERRIDELEQRAGIGPDRRSA